MDGCLAAASDDVGFEKLITALEATVVRYVAGKPVTIACANGRMMVMQKGKPDRPLCPHELN
jgi:hypothetical protein